MPVQEFALDAVRNSVQVFFSDESETVTVLLNRSIILLVFTVIIGCSRSSRGHFYIHRLV